MKIKSCLFNCCCVITILIGLLLVVVEIFFLDKIIRTQAEDGIVMTKDTYNLWGVIPGDTETFTLRNFTVFNFTNAQDFIYRLTGTPNFVEVGGFLYQQKSQFINYAFTEKDSKVNFDYWLYFDQLPESRDVDQKFHVVNVAPLGFWMQLDNAPITSFALQGFGGLFVQMNNTIKVQALGQGVSETFWKNFNIFSQVCTEISLSKELCWYVWNDRYYGINNEVKLQFWVKAAYYKDQQTKECLYQHFFPIPSIQFEALLFKIKELAETVNEVLQNWYCKNSKVCDGYTFTIKQICSSSITNDPPPGSTEEQSICSTNSTCIGSPEISTFLHHEFKDMYPDDKYQSLLFSQKSFTTLFTPYEGLLNIGTLNNIFELGKEYDISKDEKLLSALSEIFNADTTDHSFVIWEWIKYMTNQFVLKIGRGGSRKIAGLGGVFSQAWYEVNFSFANWFLRDIYSFLTSKTIGNKCQQFLKFLSQQKAAEICSKLIPDPTKYSDFYSLIEPCLNTTRFSQFYTTFNITPTDMQEYCDIDEDPSNIGLVTINVMERVMSHYNCSQNLPSKKCTEIDIIVKQLFNSLITRNPLDDPDYQFYNQSSVTVSDWNPDIPAFQYMHYLKISGVEDVQQHIESQARDLFSFDKLLNGPEVQQLFITDNEIDFYQKYHWINPSYLRNYIRFVVLEIGFGGFTQERSPKQIFFGYTDPFLDTLRTTDTMSGGDPSIGSLIAFNELNMTQEQAKINKQVMYTGADEPKKTRLYQSLFNKTYITYNRSYFDGKSPQWEMVTPWAENVQLQGSDGFSVPPNIKQQDNPSIFISSIARFAEVSFKQKINKFDMELWDMRIEKKALMSSEKNPQNAKYYQGIDCFLNSSYQGFPLYVSKNHFLDAEPEWAQLVTIVDQKGNPMTANDWDDTRLYIEPYTGTAFSATVYLQSNYLYQPDDILFPSSELFRASKQKAEKEEEVEAEQKKRMFPIVNTFRSGNISANGVEKYFGDLRGILNNKRKVALAGWLIIGLCLIIFIGVKVWKIVKGKNQKKDNKSLLTQKDNEEYS